MHQSVAPAKIPFVDCAAAQAILSKLSFSVGSSSFWIAAEVNGAAYSQQRWPRAAEKVEEAAY
jgi:hypothetical protein